MWTLLSISTTGAWREADQYNIVSCLLYRVEEKRLPTIVKVNHQLLLRIHHNFTDKLKTVQLERERERERDRDNNGMKGKEFLLIPYLDDVHAASPSNSLNDGSLADTRGASHKNRGGTMRLRRTT